MDSKNCVDMQSILQSMTKDPVKLGELLEKIEREKEETKDPKESEKFYREVDKSWNMGLNTLKLGFTRLLSEEIMVEENKIENIHNNEDSEDENINEELEREESKYQENQEEEALVEELLRQTIMDEEIDSSSMTPFTSISFEAKGEETQCLMKFDENLEQIIERDAQEGIIEEEKHAIRDLENISGDSLKCRDLLIDHGVMVHLAAQFTNTARLSMIRAPTWTLSNFYRGKPQPQIDKDVIKASICPKQIQIREIFKELEETKFALEPSEREISNDLIALL
eukprot:Gb_01284 [translate_table: standard]